MNFHIYCETNFTSVSASFPLGCWRVAMGGGSIGFKGFNSVKFENRTNCWLWYLLVL